MPDDCLKTELPECPDDAVLLDESSYSTDIHKFIEQLVQQGVATTEFRSRLIQWVADSLNQAIKKARKKAVLAHLHVSRRTFYRWLQSYFRGGEEAIPPETPRTKGEHLLTQLWKPFITTTWEKGSTNGKIMSAAAVHVKVEQEAAKKCNTEEYPAYTTVLRIVKELIEQREIQEGKCSAGQGTEPLLNTRDGKALKASYPNKVVQVDHTKVDVLSKLEDGELVLQFEKVKDDKLSPREGATRLWLSILKDSFSKCILSHLFSAKQPGSEEVALLIRRAILPKYFPADYDLRDVAMPYGFFRHLYTDGGRDLKSKHVKDIGRHLATISEELGFTCHLRRQVSDGGDAETVFHGLNCQVWSACPGYTGSSVQKRPKNVESEVCLSSQDLDKLVAWHLYAVHNHKNHPKFETRSRYRVWLDGLDEELPPVMEERKLDLCLMKVVDAKLYDHGTVRFRTRKYRGEVLKGVNAASVTLRYNPDNILRLLAFEKEVNEKPGRFLGYVEMLEDEVKLLNQWIDELELDIRKINSNKLETETLRLDEINEIRKAVTTKAQLTKKANRGTRLKYQGKQDGLIDTKKAGKQKQQAQEHTRLRAAAKASSHPENSNFQAEEIDTASTTQTIAAELKSEQPLAAVASTPTPEAVPVDPKATVQPTDADGTRSLTQPAKARNVIDMQQRLQEKNQVEFFEQQLKLAEEQRPKLIVPRRTRRF
ncbi:MAG: Mu transposase C-terminal domain-containing protein [Stenomitos rutilans HA7619-LM2]|jgi:putative transposase|nr:Mu transposase C-terminal domain-containing protein [Stenomitos rutilans HA7619-LM2]